MAPDIPVLPYPTGAARPLLRIPVLIYRLGFGWLLDAFNIMILTTRGRRSGQPRYTPLEYRRHGKKLYAIAAWGDHSHWLKNLLQDGTVTLCRGQQVMSAQASLVGNSTEATVVMHLFRRSSPLLIFDALSGRLGMGSTAARTQPENINAYTIIRFDPLADTPRLPAPPDDLRWTPIVGAALVVSLAAFALVGLLRRPSEPAHE
jgi:deazaflavin-dependent oxidoreductase (nitroreductase family)